jgi:hypothetical protein
VRTWNVTLRFITGDSTFLRNVDELTQTTQCLIAVYLNFNGYRRENLQYYSFYVVCQIDVPNFYSGRLLTSTSTIRLSLAVLNTTDSVLLLPVSLTQYKTTGRAFVCLLSHTTFDIGIPTYRPVWSDVVRAGGASHGLIDALETSPSSIARFSHSRHHCRNFPFSGRSRATERHIQLLTEAKDSNLRPNTLLFKIYILIECRHCFPVRMFTTIYRL